MQAQDTLRVLVDAEQQLRPEGARGGTHGEAGLELMDIGVDSLTVELSDTLQKVISVLEVTPQTSHHYEVKDVSFSLAVENDGHMALVSPVSGASEEHTGFTFTLSRTGTSGEEITPNLTF
jgi:hypothetical protein